MRFPRSTARRGFTLLLLPLTFILAPLLHAEPQFIGILESPREIRFRLIDPATGRTGWLTVSSHFDGYTITAFEPKTDTLTLTRNGATLKLRLIDDAKVTPSRLDLTGSITIGAGEKLQITRATLLYDQENIFPLKDGIVYKITPTRHDDGNIVYAIVIERAVSSTQVDRLASPRIKAIPNQPFKLQFGDYAFEFTPR